MKRKMKKREEKNEESHALVDFIYNSFFSVNERKKNENEEEKRKKPQMKLFERTYTETRMAHTTRKEERSSSSSRRPVSHASVIEEMNERERENRTNKKQN